MIIGIPKEIKNHEYRIGATPRLVRTLVHAGHKVLVQKNGGAQIGYSDELYQKAGARIVETAHEVYSAEMIIKVKEPQSSEFDLLKEGQILFCFLHLAPDPVQTKALLEKKVVAIAWETVTNAHKQLPILVPMSEIAGRIAVQAGATALQLNHGGKGILLGGVPGVRSAKVMVIGAGVVGLNSARMAMGLGADVSIFDTNLDRLRSIDNLYGSSIKTFYSSYETIEEALPTADLIIGSVLIPGKLAPKVITKKMLSLIEPGSVMVDVAIDQGGCFETSKATTHTNPIYTVEGVLHYCVANMPGACARSATEALTNAMGHYAVNIANKGYKKALLDDPGLLEGLNTYYGHVTNVHVAEDLGYTYFPAQKALHS